VLRRVRGRQEVGSWVLWDLCERVLVYCSFMSGLASRKTPRELTLRSSPTSLSDVKAASYRPRVRLAALCIHKTLLRLDDSAWLALIVYAQYFAPDLELSALGAYGQGLEKLDLALAVENTFRIELGYALNGRAVAARVEVDDFLVGVLEREDDGVGRECRKGRVEFLSHVRRASSSGDDEGNGFKDADLHIESAAHLGM
jgi:hypothetical protein